MSKLNLSDVTLVCIDDVCQELAAVAVKDCLDKVKFGSVHIYTDDFGVFRRHLGSDASDEADDTIELRKVKNRSLEDVMWNLWYEVPKHIKTSHALIVQWDSGIVDPS